MEYTSRNARVISRLGGCGAFGMAALELAEEYENFAVLTADLCTYSGLDRFAEKYPQYLYNLGIAEQNMVGVAAGMAKEGMNVFATTYASFAATRTCDQIRVNMGYMKFPIKLIGLTAGLTVGILGATHIALEDVAIMRSIPNITVISPADGFETIKAVKEAAKMQTPVYIRLTGSMNAPIVYHEDYEFKIGKMITLRSGADVSIFATGTMVHECLKAADLLHEQGIEVCVVDVHTIKPLDKETVKKVFSASKLIVTAEEHSIIGGLGSAIADYKAQYECAPKLIKIGIKEEFPHAASYEYLLKQHGLTSSQIAQRILEELN